MTSSLSLPKPFARAQRLSRRVGAIFPDIEKAFDRVWHNGLHYELLHMNAPAVLLRWISSSLRDRTVKSQNLRPHIQGNLRFNYGVSPRKPYPPSSLSLLPKLPKLLPNTRRSLFADEFMIYTESSITRSQLRSSHYPKLHQICQGAL